MPGLFTITLKLDTLDKVLDDFVRYTPKFCEKHDINFEERFREAQDILQQCDYDRWLAFAAVWRSMSRSAKDIEKPSDLYCHISCMIGCLEAAYRDHRIMEEMLNNDTNE